MPNLLILHASLGDDPLDLPAARLASGLAEKARTTLFLPGGHDPESAAAKALSKRPAVEVGRGGKRPMLAALAVLVQRLKARGVDHLLATGNRAGWLAAAANVAAGRPARVTVKLDRPLSPQNAVVRRLQTAVWTEAARVLVPSEADRKALVGRFPAIASRFHAVSEPIVPAAGRALPPPRHKGDMRMLVASGRIEAESRFDLLVDALPHIPQARLTILGSGPDEARLIRRAVAAGVQDRLTFQREASLAACLRDADLYLLAHAREALPPHLVEALANDRGVVATDSFAAARDLLDGAPGCAVVRRADPALIAAAAQQALDAGPRPSLRPIAERHDVAAAVQAHGWAMGLL